MFNIITYNMLYMIDVFDISVMFHIYACISFISRMLHVYVCLHVFICIKMYMYVMYW